jgi:hypothetical protein
LIQGKVRTENLARVQKRREFPTRAIQIFQNLLQKQFLGKVLQSQTEVKISPVFKFFLKTPGLRNIQPWFIAYGVRHEHVKYV